MPSPTLDIRALRLFCLWWALLALAVLGTSAEAAAHGGDASAAWFKRSGACVEPTMGGEAQSLSTMAYSSALPVTMAYTPGAASTAAGPTAGNGAAPGGHTSAAGLTPANPASWPPCQPGELDDAANPEYNVCFEGNPAPISTIPRLLARLQAELASTGVLESALALPRAIIDAEIAATERLFSPTTPESTPHATSSSQTPGVNHDASASSVRTATGPSRPTRGEDGASCGYISQQCNSMPLLPAGLTLASIAPMVEPAPFHPDVPRYHVDVPEQAPLARLRIGPALEHRALPHRPPIV